jgi:hypothetical protein
MRFRLFILTILLSASGHIKAQKMDSLLANTLNFDSLQIPQNPLDSVQLSFYSKADSLKQEYRQKLAGLDSSKRRIQSRIDSLASLQLPTGKYTAKLDSLNQKRERLVGSLNEKIGDLKSKTLGKINNLELPPELKEKVSSVTQNIEGFKLPVKDLNIPSLDLPNNPLSGLDGLNTSIESPLGKIGEIDGLKNVTDQVGGLSKITDQVGDLSKITDQAGGISNDIQSITSGDLGKANELSGNLEGKAAEAAGLDQLKQGSEVLNNPLLSQAQNPEALKEQAVEQVQQAAVDHFAGKEQQLQAAMAQVSKLKQKYSSLNSLSEIPKKRPNEMKGKPLVQRLVPGIGLQILKATDLFMTDFNSYLGYRFNGRLTGGLGWNQRFAYNTIENNFNAEARVYGPRIYSEYKLGKGFCPRVEVEVLNTFVPPYVRQVAATDNGERQWVPGAFIGMKKEFRFMKRVKGTTMIMMRLYNPEHTSPYAEVVNIRFGFEFPRTIHGTKRKIQK